MPSSPLHGLSWVFSETTPVPLPRTNGRFFPKAFCPLCEWSFNGVPFGASVPIDTPQPWFFFPLVWTSTLPLRHLGPQSSSKQT